MHVTDTVSIVTAILDVDTVVAQLVASLLTGFAEEAMTALEVQTQENARLRQQMASDTARMPANSHEPTLVSSVS